MKVSEHPLFQQYWREITAGREDMADSLEGPLHDLRTALGLRLRKLYESDFEYIQELARSQLLSELVDMLLFEDEAKEAESILEKYSTPRVTIFFKELRERGVSEYHKEYHELAGLFGKFELVSEKELRKIDKEAAKFAAEQRKKK